MLSLIVAGVIAAGTCARDAGLSDEAWGDVVTCVVVPLPTVIDMLRERNPSWSLAVINPTLCRRQPISFTYQVNSGADGMIEFLERLVQAGVITLAIDRDQSRIALTCLDQMPGKKGSK